MSIADRLLTIVITATVTSAAWIVAGGTFINIARVGPTRATPSTATAAESRSARSGGVAVDALVAAGAAASSDDGATEALVIPVEGVKASDLQDTFGDPRAGGGHAHEAIDIMAVRGTPVIAAAPGNVERLFLSKAGGNTIYVRSQDGRTIYYYAHLDNYATGLAEGQQVRRGERIGAVGSSGNASPDAPHLHFAMMRTSPESDWWEPATAINPYPRLVGQ